MNIGDVIEDAAVQLDPWNRLDGIDRWFQRTSSKVTTTVWRIGVTTLPWTVANGSVTSLPLHANLLALPVGAVYVLTTVCLSCLGRLLSGEMKKRRGVIQDARCICESAEWTT
jgi:hypothetical protein